MNGRRRPALALVALAGLLVGTACSGTKASSPAPRKIGTSSTPPSRATSAAPATVAPAPTPTGLPVAASSAAPLKLVATIGGNISPKSVDASPAGLVTAQNMIYTHTITVYDTDHHLVSTISDGVNLASFGIAGHPGISHGGPVEATYTRDGHYAYVSNYSMYGVGFAGEGHDVCSPANHYDNSYVYRVDLHAMKVDQVIPVGSVPKFLAITPDQSKVVVSDWCSYDTAVIDTASARVVRRVSMGPYPRGIAISPDSSTAYVAVMGATYLQKVNLSTYATVRIAAGGSGPRHVVISPDGRTLYVTLNGSGKVAKLDLASGKVLAVVSTGSDPRTMAMTPDGKYLFVVNYFSNTVTQLATATMTAVQTVPTGSHPIGVTVVPTTGEVWVANYSGTIEVFDQPG